MARLETEVCATMAKDNKSRNSASKTIGAAEIEKAAPADSTTIEELVAANHILYAQSVVDGFGHVSVRHDTNPARFWLSRSMAPGLVTTDDIMEFDLDSNPIDARGRGTYVERFIHGEIYRRRPDVKAIVHSHSPAVIPFGVTNVPLKPIFHMSAFIGAGVPVFEIREVSKATDMLIRDSALGLALAKRLEAKPAVLMRGHGAVAVGVSLPQAVFRAVYLEINARLQAEAMRLGKINFLNPDEAKLAAAGNDMHVLRPWMLWRHEIAQRKSL
jgi:HCOMODA/2-hydroxy-3-carboxy-muconic semialdehyde decarboxylase